MTRYSIEPRAQIFMKQYGVLSFAKNTIKSLGRKYSQKSMC